MLIPRVIPCLLLKGQGLVKGARFKDHKYVGDPINAVRIFNEMRADELIFLDISATPENRCIPLDFVERVAEECFMPFAVGGGIRTLGQIRDILKAGAEKVALNTAAMETPDLIRQAADTFGSQSVVAAIDVNKRLFGGREVYVRCGRKKTGMSPEDAARQAERHGAGEILLTSVEREGTFAGYDIPLTRSVSEAVGVPVIASGGANGLEDVRRVFVEGRADAAAAGALFVLHGPKRAVLVSYPERKELEAALSGLRAMEGVQ